MYTYGGDGFDQGTNVVSAEDGFLMCGYSGSFDSSGASIYLLKTDLSGNVVFSKTVGGVSHDIPKGLTATYDGGFAICGITRSFGLADANIFLLKTDSAGELQWMKTFSTEKRERAFDLIQTADSGFAITGHMQYGPLADVNNKMFLIKTDHNGTLEWNQTYGGSVYEESVSVLETNSGGYLLIGYTQSYGAGGNDIYVLKTDSAGNVEWARTYGTSLNEIGKDAIATTDSSFVVLGTSENCGFGNTDILVLKINAAGDTLWCKCLGTAALESGVQLLQDHNNNLDLLGVSPGTSGFDIQLLQLSIQGDFIKSTTLKAAGPQQSTGIALTPDSGLVITGYSSTEDDPTDDLLAIKVDRHHTTCSSTTFPLNLKSVDLTITDSVQLFTETFSEQTHTTAEFTTNTMRTDLCVIDLINTSSPPSLNIFPNPFTDVIKFNITINNAHLPLRLHIYDPLARLIVQQQFDGPEMILNTNNFSSGIYFYRLTAGTKFCGKGILIKQ